MDEAWPGPIWGRMDEQCSRQHGQSCFEKSARLHDRHQLYRPNKTIGAPGIGCKLANSVSEGNRPRRSARVNECGGLAGFGRDVLGIC